jgi:hypothetical protein
MAELRGTLERINSAWRTGAVDRLGDDFHPDIVIVGPGYRELARGREACVASYREFLRSSVVRAYRESNVVVREFESSAVATYDWEMDYEQGGKLHREVGTDLFVLEKHARGWLTGSGTTG